MAGRPRRCSFDELPPVPTPLFARCSLKWGIGFSWGSGSSPHPRCGPGPSLYAPSLARSPGPAPGPSELQATLGPVSMCRGGQGLHPRGSPGAGAREAPAKGASKGIFRDFTSDTLSICVSHSLWACLVALGRRVTSLANPGEGVMRARVESRDGHVTISASTVTPQAPFLQPPPLPWAQTKP